MFQTALLHGRQYLEAIRALVATSAYIPQWSLCLAFAPVAGVNLSGYQVSPPAPWEQDAPAPMRNRLREIFGANGRATGEAIIRDICDRLSHDLPGLQEGILEVQHHLNTIVGTLSKYHENLSGDDGSLASRRLQRLLRSQDHKAMLAAHDATLLLAKSLLSHGPALNAYLSMRDPQDDSDLGPAVIAIGGAMGIATSLGTAAAPFTWGALMSTVAGAAWPTVWTVTNPAGLVFGGAMLFVALVLKNRHDAIEALVTPEKKFLSLLSYSCKVLNEARLFFSAQGRLPKNSTREDVSNHIDEVGITPIRTRWRTFLQAQEDDVGGTVLVVRYLSLRLVAERDALREQQETVDMAVGRSDDEASDEIASSSDENSDED